MTITAPPAAPPQGAPRRLLPHGAAAWSRTYVDHDGRPAKADHLVPVDANGQRTEHIRVICGRVQGGQECPREEWVLPDASVIYCPDHGAPLTGSQTREPMLPWAEIRRSAEAPARPMWILLAEGATGAALEAGHVAPTWALLAGAASTWGAWWYTRRHLTRRAVRTGALEAGQATGRRVGTIGRRARAAAYAGCLGTAWLTAAAAVDPTSVAGRIVWGALPVVWAAGAAPWWRYQAAQRNRRPVEPPTPAEPVVDVPAGPSADELAAADAAERWTKYAGIPKTHLDVATWRRTPFGWQAVVVADEPGALSGLADTDNLRRTLGKVAAAFDRPGAPVPRSAVTLVAEHEDSPNRALLLIQPHNPLKDGRVWGGPATIDMAKGVAESGYLIDGTVMVERLYRYGWGAPSAIDIGSTGGGKSERVRRKLVVERWATIPDPASGEPAGAFISMLHDPKRGQAYSEFLGAVHAWGMTHDDAHMMIDALLRECFRRYDSMRDRSWRDGKGRQRHGSPCWNPLTDGPIISVYWDEFHELAGDKEFVGKIEKLARYQRACGMRAELLTHMATLGDTGSQALRALLAGGRATLFQTTSGLTGPLVTGGQLTGDPRTLPKLPGMCFVSDGETPTLVGRESWIPDDDHAAPGQRAVYDWLYDDHNQPIGYPAVIPAETAAAFGREFMEWAEAGRKPGGRDSTSNPGAAFLPAAKVDDLAAEDALRRIVFDAGRPLARGDIIADPRWRWNATSSLTAATNKGRTASPPWLVRLSGGGQGVRFDLTPEARAEMKAAADEVAEEAA